MAGLDNKSSAIIFDGGLLHNLCFYISESIRPTIYSAILSNSLIAIHSDSTNVQQPKNEGYRIFKTIAEVVKTL